MSKNVDIEMTYDEAIEYANSFNIGGYDYWRVVYYLKFA